MTRLRSPLDSHLSLHSFFFTYFALRDATFDCILNFHVKLYPTLILLQAFALILSNLAFLVLCLQRQLAAAEVAHSLTNKRVTFPP